MSRRAIHEQFSHLVDLPDEGAIAPPDVTALPAPIERTRRAPAVNRAQGLEKSDLAGKLEQLSGDALDRASDLLEMDISNDEDDKFGEKVRGLNSVIKTVLQTQVRVDEHRLKSRKLDALPELLELIKAEEKQRAARTVSQT